VDLAEFEGVEVVGEGIVGCVLEVYGNIRCLYGSINVGVDACLPESEWTAIFCVADILEILLSRLYSSLVRERLVVELEALKDVVGDSSGGWKGVHSGKARPDPGRWFRDSRPPHWSFHHLEHHNFTHHRPAKPYNTRISSTTGKMSQPVVQTIHRDPALLYVEAMIGDDKASLTFV
jgi:hypothetical protein